MATFLDPKQAPGQSCLPGFLIILLTRISDNLAYPEFYPIAHAREFRHRAVSHGWTYLYNSQVGLSASG